MFSFCADLCPYKPQQVGMPEPESDSYQCEAKVVKYKTIPPKCYHIVAVNHESPNETKLVLFQNSDPAMRLRFYLDHGWKPTVDGIPTELKGSCLIQVPYVDQDTTKDPALEINVQDPNKIEGLYVAFDTRAARPPDWLAISNNYDNQVFGITSTEPDFTKPKSWGKVPNVQYKVWKYKKPGSVVKLGGNNATGVHWQTGEIGSQYLVFVKSKPEVDHTKYDKIDTMKIEVCSIDNTNVYKVAQNKNRELLTEWLERPENTIYKQANNEDRIGIEFQAGDCKPVQDTTITPPNHKICGKVDKFGNTTSFLNAWPVRSTAFIDNSQSKATVQRVGDTGPPHTSAARGSISFLLNENRQVEIGEISLFGNNMNVSGYSFEQISVGQRRTLTAKCADNPHKDPFHLCTDYEIPAAATDDDALIGGRAWVNGEKYYFISLSNEDPIPIKVDINKRQFTMAGSGIRSNVEQIGDVKLSLEIVGKFINFAPVANTDETPLEGRFPCINKDKGKGTLGSASYDQDQSRLSLTTNWVEDAGLLSERVLGNEQILDNVTMNFGGHAITLFVKDNKDVETWKTITVEIYDPKVDKTDPPDDVFVQYQEGQSTVVDIGEAKGADECSGSVNTTNNAPPGLRFPVGYTPVDWAFDDWNGNVIFHLQKVFVVLPDYYPPPVAESSGQLETLPDGTQKLTYEYKTIAKNKVVHADEYIYITDPDNDRFYFDGNDVLGGPNWKKKHATNRKFGNNDTQDILVFNQFDTSFTEPGVYTVSYTLVPTGKNFEPQNYIAHDQIELEYGSPP